MFAIIATSVFLVALVLIVGYQVREMLTARTANKTQ